MNMHLKNTIVFICLATCTLRCQGVDPTREQRASIKDIVAEKVGQDGIDFDEIKYVFTIVANSIDMSGVLSRIDDLKINFISRDIVKILTLAVVTRDTKPEISSLINDIVKANVEKDYTNVDVLKVVFTKVALIANLPNKFPSIDELQWIALGSTDEITADEFTRREVLIYCLAFVASENPTTAEIVQNNVQMHENPNGMAYEDLKNVVDGVRHELGITKPFMDYAEFKLKFLLRKYTAKEVEKIVIDNLFKGSFSV